ncbi:probable phosphoglycerate mutase [Sinosporangium album]|uniref:Probable phosphoglycerate mutase n=1 Tax=Sinosporangium album TaxID=504805 RepID=A0A1G7XIT8_9ACTN|nr:histidine phosphatase family protein [Sinosporangium album]SDG83961.1 probable phosphoglycerate mutase [Sinosporangium album]
MIVTELIFVRHGQAQCNADGVVGGPRTCTGLTDLGRRQMILAAERLAISHQRRPFTHLYAGPRPRLQESGSILAQAIGLPLVIANGLDGPRHGDADGKPWYEVKTAFRGGSHVHPDLPWAPGSDTWNGYLQRVGTVLSSLIRDHQGGRVLLAAHGETVLAAHTLLLRLRPDLTAGFTVDHASLTHWQLHRNRFDDERWMLYTHNDTAHLPDQEAS